ncbi:MAG: DUF1538 domain-containing protein [Ruminococcaceae bacterium]|nr:DUF1538 domain-containing protein [Oscillospiraceae bacterium]
MNRLLFDKVKEALFSVLPVTLIVIILNFTPLVNLSLKELLVFTLSAIFLILGIGFFTLGADIAMTPMGEHVGSGLTKSRNLKLLLIICFALGVLITIAEPDLTVLADQVGSKLIIVFVGLGVGLFLVLSILKIVLKKDLGSMLVYFYMVLFALALVLVSSDPGKFQLLPLSFDSGGVTTGPITVPFIMALGVGIATTIGGRNASENSFGLVAMCSVGPILAVLLLSIVNSGDITAPAIDDYMFADNMWAALGHTLLDTTKNVTIALGMVVAFFFIINFIFLKLPKKKLIQISIGAVITYVGLIIFLTSVHIGFMPVGFKMGQELAKASPIAIIIVGFVLGLVVVLAEPAVHVLNKQVEDITNGTVSKTSMMLALSIGVGLSICLSVIRIIFGFSIMFYLVPGYLISLGLSFFVPKIYTAIAFDSGGVASGPLTSTFILPFAIGSCVAVSGNILSDAFGIVAMVAMTPLITIQLLGFTAISKKKVSEKLAMKRILDDDDDQIIRFL